MTSVEIETALEFAFGECEAVGCPLDIQQKHVLLRSLVNWLMEQDASQSQRALADVANPLDELTCDQRQNLLQFIQEQQQQNQSWKAQLLNDWLHGRESGNMQFIREQYGLPWLERVMPMHIAQYADAVALRLKVGDRIEVSSGLWEWVQDEGPCVREWFACTVVGITETKSAELAETAAVSAEAVPFVSCVIRFDNGTEYEIQGIYEWNRYNWRWLESS